MYIYIHHSITSTRSDKQIQMLRTFTSKWPNIYIYVSKCTKSHELGREISLTNTKH